MTEDTFVQPGSTIAQQFQIWGRRHPLYAPYCPKFWVNTGGRLLHPTFRPNTELIPYFFAEAYNSIFYD